MPRNDPTRIDARQTIDSSQTANVGLQVQANTRAVGRSGAAWALAQALNTYAASSAEDAQRTAAQRKVAQDKKDKTDGEAAAAEAAVTGVQKTNEELAQHSAIYTQAYQATDGIRQANQFDESLKPVLAQLEPGADIDAVIQQHANEFVSNANMPEETRKAFMENVAKAQPQWKQDYLKHSITESMKREEENHQAILTGDVNRTGSLTPDMLTSWRQAGAQSGLTDYEMDEMAVKALAPSIASGKINIDQTLDVLKGHNGADGRVLYDVYQQDIDQAATAGKRVQDQERKKAQESALTQELFASNDRADQGMLSDRNIEAMRVKYDLTPEWAAGMHNKNREAQQRLAKEAEKADDERKLASAFLLNDAVHNEALGADKVNKAGEKAFMAVITAGIEKNDFSTVPQYIAAAARNNMKLEGYGRILAGLSDTSNPARFDQAYQLYKQAQNIAPGWADANLDTKTLGLLKQYDRRLTVYGDNSQQALAGLRNQPDINPDVLASEKRAVMKKIDGKALIPDFDDGSLLKFKGSTKVSNIPEVNSAIYGYIEDAHRNGMFFGDPQGAIDYAKDRFKADYVKVGDRYERGFGSATSYEGSAKVGNAMDEMGKVWKDKLVAAKVIDPEDKVGFAPTPHAPNKWTLFYLSGGIRRVMTHDVEVNGHKQTLPIEAVATDTAGKYQTWRAQEDKRASVNKQGYDQFGLTGLLTHDDPASLTKRIDKMLDQDMTPEGSDLRLSSDQVKHAQRLEKAREFVTSPDRLPQSFGDFLNTTK
jgi:hypothetical protein